MSDRLRNRNVAKIQRFFLRLTILAIALSPSYSRFCLGQNPAADEFSPTAPVSPATENSTTDIQEEVDEISRRIIARDYDEAIQQGLKCIRHPEFDKAPDNLKAMTFACLGIAYNSSGRHEMAAHVSLMFGQIFPDHGLPHLIRAEALRNMKQFRAEREALAHALIITPESVETRIRLARSQADWPGSTKADGEAGLRILASIIEDPNIKTDSVELHDAVAIAAAVAGEKSLAHSAAVNAVVASDDDGRSEREQRRKMIDMDQPVQLKMTPPEHVLNRTTAIDFYKDAVLSLSFEGIVRCRPTESSQPAVLAKITREYPGVLIGPLGLILSTSRIAELPEDLYPGHDLEWESLPVITVSRRDPDTGKMMQSGTAVVRAFSSNHELAVLNLESQSGYSPFEGLLDWTPIAIAADYRMDWMLQTQDENHILHVAAYDLVKQQTVIRSQSLKESIDLIRKGEFPPGTPVFNDSGELMMIASPPRNISNAGDENDPRLPVIVHSSECSFVYNCLSAYGEIPTRHLPVPVEFKRRGESSEGDGSFSLVVKANSADGALSVGDEIVSFRSIPISSPSTIETILRLAHESFIENIDVELKDGRTVNIPLVASGQRGDRESADRLSADRQQTLSNPNQSEKETRSLRQQLTQWLTENVSNGDAVQLIEDEAAKAERLKKGIRTLIGSSFTKNEVPVVQFDRSGTLVSCEVSPTTAALMGLKPNILLAHQVSSNLTRVEPLFSVENAAVSPVFKSFAATEPKDRGLEVTFELKALKEVDNNTKVMVRIETGNGGFSAYYTVRNRPSAGESTELRLIIEPEHLEMPLADADFLFIEVCIQDPQHNIGSETLDQDKLSICGDSVYRPFEFN
ncbi:MAG: hypothetical protein JNL58_27155 [Planctomyces sp.]|nr:hypothetical protein [Planctomyces sp.]